MHLAAPAIVLAVRVHGEHGAVVRALTEAAGVQPGYVRGGRSRRLRPVLQPGNRVAGEWRARTDAQLPALVVELTHSVAPLHGEPLAAAAIDWATALVAAALPEVQPYPAVYRGLDGLLGAVEAAPSARGWAAALARFELLLLAELGFGIDLDRCGVTEADGPALFVSPRTGVAVGAAAAAGWEERLLPVPAFLRGEGGAPDGGQLVAGLALTGHLLARELLVDRRAAVLDARARLVERLKRAVA
jgi:DNA repair protein RecO (recombination protein O)